MDIMAYLSRQSRRSILVLTCLLVVVVGFIDYLTIPPFSFELFYFVPILLAAWFAGRMAGVSVALACTAAKILADILPAVYHSGLGEGISAIGRAGASQVFWNVMVDLGVFLMVAQFAAALEHQHRAEEAARLAVFARADELKSALLQAVSHDLRTPLASIKASVTSLLDSSVEWDKSARQALLEGIDEECDRLSRLVANLLDMSRIESGMVHLKRDWYSIDEVIHTVVRRLRPYMSDHPVEVCVPQDLPLVLLDFDRMEQVLTNLVDNAVRHTPLGTSIRISASVRDGALLVEVEDNGPGVAQEHLPHLFDRFYRVRGHESLGSAGLGLSVAQGMVEAHGGSIAAQNRPEGGLRICFSLPLGTGGPLPGAREEVPAGGRALGAASQGKD